MDVGGIKMELTLLSCFWLVSALVIFMFHFWTTTFERWMPDVLKAAYMYGKQKASKKIESKTLFPVPKSWYFHFYASGFLVHGMVLSMLVLHLLRQSDVIRGMEAFWDIMRYPATNITDTNGVAVLMFFVVEWIQMARRLYECLAISSFSKGTMSPIHYVYGVIYYTTMGLGLLASVDIGNLSFHPAKGDVLFYLPALLLFIWASFFQHKSMLTFASLRTVKTGKVAKGHFVPEGHLFQWVSCPHYLCEIVIYLSFCLMFRMGNVFLNSLFVFVVVNQISLAVMAHDWYQTTFSNYPKQRKAVLPYIL